MAGVDAVKIGKRVGYLGDRTGGMGIWGIVRDFGHLLRPDLRADWRVGGASIRDFIPLVKIRAVTKVTFIFTKKTDICKACSKKLCDLGSLICRTEKENRFP